MTKAFRSHRMRLIRGIFAAALAGVVVLSGGVVATSASADAPRPQRDPGTYQNPLRPGIPGGGTVDSCADPTVLRGQQPGDTAWYMYCTTDPLNDDDLGADGGLAFRRIPTMTSTDLVNWTYVGEAFDTVPDWAAPEAALWAPDVVYSSTFEQYYLFTVVTDTADDVSGVPGCTSDSAIGVATSATPTGPWTFSDEPVVGPRANGPGCDFLWTYDPDVLGDTIGDTGTFYYGSYFGGVFGTDLTLTADGATADVAGSTLIALDNKYEGANVVERDGYYYLFLSATNCCNGALTGYSVFVGRSTTPLGPFVDQQGNSLVDPQTGGTPFLTMNGNRWVGLGHNTVFEDAGGQWWTVYHAVDQRDPFFATQVGFTRRPVLLDAIDWIDGWPTVNGGQGASDRRVPAPAGQPGQQSRHRVQQVRTQEPARALRSESDEFAGTSLRSEWSWDWAGDEATAPPTPSTVVAGGSLRVPIQAADLFVDVDNAYTLLRQAPRGDYVVEARVRVDVPDDGCCFNFAQAGIALYGDEDDYVKLTNTSIFNTRQTEFAKEIRDVPDGWARYGNTVVGPPSEEWTYLRIVVERLSGRERRDAGGDTESYTAYTSQDGRAWVRGGTWTQSLGRDARIGLVAFGLQDAAQQFTAEFDYVRSSTLRERRVR